MAIRINVDNIKDLDQAKEVINKLAAGMNNCYAADFEVCENCGAIMTKGYICWNCSYDPTAIEGDE